MLSRLATRTPHVRLAGARAVAAARSGAARSVKDLHHLVLLGKFIHNAAEIDELLLQCLKACFQRLMLLLAYI